MKQNYRYIEVIAPGTGIICAAAQCTDINQVIEPVAQPSGGALYYINMSFEDYALGGSSFAQVLNKIGSSSPDIKDAGAFVNTFNIIQSIIKDNNIVSGHDVGSGGLITTLLEICFSGTNI